MISLDFLDFEPSSYCTAKCLMCPRDKAKYKDVNMSFDIFKKALDEAAVKHGITSIRLCGIGDPFCDSNLAEKVKYSKREYPHISVALTNTLNFYNEEVLNYIDSVKISNYGATKKAYESIHGGSAKYETAMSNINRLLSLPDEVRPYITMSFLILPQNEGEMDTWISFWEEKVDEITVWRPHTWAGGVEKIATSIEDNGKPRSCGRPFYNDIVIRANGFVSVCCYDYNSELAIGDLNESSLSSILEGERLKYIQEVHKSARFAESGLVCKDCDQIYDRSDSLVYSSSNRKTSSIIIGAGKPIDLSGGE